MASLQTSHRINPQSAFTLLEVIMVVSIVAIIGTLSAYFGIDSYRSYAFHADRDVLITALQHARAQAVGNICLPTSTGCTDGKPHGVALYPNSFVAYQGTSSTTRDADVDAVINSNPNTVRSGTMDITFTQLSATTTGGVITLTDSVTGRASVITVGTEGEISWTN